MILGVIACALLCQQRSIAAIADWAQDQQALVLTAFHPARQRLPSEATIRWALRAVDVSALEQHIAALGPDTVSFGQFYRHLCADECADVVGQC